MQVGIADYGMNVWDGACFDFIERCVKLKEIGYDGIERLTVFTPEEAVMKVARLRQLGMNITTVRGPSVELSIQWTAGLGKDYVWTQVSESKQFDVFCRQVNWMSEVSHKWGVHAALHNHMGTLVETQEQLEQFLKECPKSRLVFDTAHLAAMGGDGVEIVKKYIDRIQVIHVKDWLLLNPDAERWNERGRFCGLGEGNIGLDNIEILNAAVRSGYKGWIFVEHDTHLQDPLIDLMKSRQYLKKGGF